MSNSNLKHALNMALFTIKDDLTITDYNQLEYLFHLGALTAAKAIQMGADIDDIIKEVDNQRSK